MTIADTLFEAADDIRDYADADGLDHYGDLADEIRNLVERMDELRMKIDARHGDTAA